MRLCLKNNHTKIFKTLDLANMSSGFTSSISHVLLTPDEVLLPSTCSKSFCNDSTCFSCLEMHRSKLAKAFRVMHDVDAHSLISNRSAAVKLVAKCPSRHKRTRFCCCGHLLNCMLSNASFIIVILFLMFSNFTAYLQKSALQKHEYF